MKRTIIVLVFSTFNILLFAQEMEFGNVTKQELKEQSYINDSTAHAVVLYKYRNSYYHAYDGGSQVITEIYEKIKIYDEQGYDFATEYINLYKTRRDIERLGKIQAYTYNLENGKIVKSELGKDQTFRDEIRYNYDQVKFTMPNVKKGSIIEFKYKITSPYTWNIDEFRFQEEIPIKKIKVILTMPKGFNFKPTYKGYVSFYPKKSSVNNSRLSVPLIINTFDINNVPALKDEIYIDNISNYRAGVIYELVSVQLPTFNRTYAQTWSDVAKSIGSNEDYNRYLKKSSTYDEQIDLLISGVSKAEERMKLIFDYVKQNIVWNGIDGKYFYYGMKKALKEKKGNSGDINLTLVSMLRYAGISAHPVVISTKENAIPFYPTLDRLNYVIAYAVINNKKYFLDATDEFADINILPIRDYNWQGIFINNPDKVWKKISLKKPDIAVRQNQINAKLKDDGTIEGMCKSRLTNHHAKKFRENFKNQNLESFITNKEQEYDNIEISDYTLKNENTYRGFVTESFNYYQEDGAEVAGDKLYLNPMTFLKVTENPFKREERILPIDFGYAFKDNFIINIEIPEGYTVETSPEKLVMKASDDNATFKFMPSINGNKIQLSVTFELKRAMIGADSYQILKEFFNQVINKESEKIVLKKI